MCLCARRTAKHDTSCVLRTLLACIIHTSLAVKRSPTSHCAICTHFPGPGTATICTNGPVSVQMSVVTLQLGQCGTQVLPTDALHEKAPSHSGLIQPSVQIGQALFDCLAAETVSDQGPARSPLDVFFRPVDERPSRTTRNR